MMKIKVELIISSEVYINDEIIKNAQEELGKVLSKEEVAQRLLFAFLNPKLPSNDILDNIDGHWDGICDFKNKIKNLSLNI